MVWECEHGPARSRRRGALGPSTAYVCCGAKRRQRWCLRVTPHIATSDADARNFGSDERSGIGARRCLLLRKGSKVHRLEFDWCLDARKNLSRLQIEFYTRLMSGACKLHLIGPISNEPTWRGKNSWHHCPIVEGLELQWIEVTVVWDLPPCMPPHLFL